jgi:hypothetical protein
MDSIDITSPEFSLEGISELKDIISDTISLDNNFSDYNLYIYIGIILLVGIIAYFIYKTYATNGVKKVTFQDKLDECYAEGVCQR